MAADIQILLLVRHTLRSVEQNIFEKHKVNDKSRSRHEAKKGSVR